MAISPARPIGRDSPGSFPGIRQPQEDAQEAKSLCLSLRLSQLLAFADWHHRPTTCKGFEYDLTRSGESQWTKSAKTSCRRSSLPR